MDARMNQDHQRAQPGQGLVQLEQGFRLAETDHLALAHRIKEGQQYQHGAGDPQVTPDPHQIEIVQQGIADDGRQDQRPEHQQKGDDFFTDQ